MERIITERLILREWNLSDSKDFYEFAKSDLVGPNAGWEPHKSEEESKALIQMFIRQNNNYAIVLKKENKVIGNIGFYRRKHDENYKHFVQREIGYSLNPEYWGKGYMTEALEALIEYTFNRLNVEIIWCSHFDSNFRSKAVIEKCGFTYKLTQKDFLPMYRNKEVTSLVYYKVNPRVAEKVIACEKKGRKF